jgi:hypothetical protein
MKSKRGAKPAPLTTPELRKAIVQLDPALARARRDQLTIGGTENGTNETRVEGEGRISYL